MASLLWWLQSGNLDVLNPSSWKKGDKPVFKTDSARLQFGPSNPSFTKAPGGKWLMVRVRRRLRIY